jgi:hypothetical protein
VNELLTDLGEVHSRHPVVLVGLRVVLLWPNGWDASVETKRAGSTDGAILGYERKVTKPS